MSQKDKYFFNINKTDKGIFRELGEGINTRIFPGDQAMVSVVKIDPNSTPGGGNHGIIGGSKGAVIFDIFSPPRNEYKKPGSGFAAD